MTDSELIKFMREHFERLFPKVCPKCHHCFSTLREYILSTKRIGTTISYDAELGDWETSKPLGAFALANCSCGTTMALTTEGIPLPQIHSLLNWVKTSSQERGLTPVELLDYVRDEIRKQVLAESDHGANKD